MLPILTVIIVGVLVGNVHGKTINRHDICVNSSRHRIYLEFGEVGYLDAKNITNNFFSNDTTQQYCQLEFVTCPSCVIFLNFRYLFANNMNRLVLCISKDASYQSYLSDSFLNLSNNCERSFSNACLCEYIQISEHPYEEFSTQKFCNGSKNNITIKTSTKNVIIKFVYKYKNNYAFTAEYSSQRNRLFLSDTKLKNEILSSPYFPSYYLNDLSTEYIITCPKHLENCRVRLLFSDFQIATMSIMEFFDWNGLRLDVVTGIHFRPPIFISNGPSLVARFYANGGTGLGFKAKYSFISDQVDENTTDYITDCGGFVDNLGGGITMMNMVQNAEKKYYCFWIIKPQKNFLHFKTHLYLKIANFSEMEDNTKVMVQQGSTSAGKILEVLRSPNTDIYPVNPREHVQPIDIGFYVSLKGVFGVKSRLAIVYAAFTYKDCFSGTDFLCENHRCIPRQLTCDGFDHCGDASDEPASCYRDPNPEPMDRRWYSHTPNYFFPKIDPYSDLKTATLIFIVSTLGLISLVSALFVLLYRMNSRTRHDRTLQNHLQIITDLLEEEVLDTDSITDDPPVYEAPPDYEDVIKIECERLKLRRPRRKKRKPGVKTQNNLGIKETAATYPNGHQSTSSPPPEYEASSNTEVKRRKPLRKHNPLVYFSDKAISSNVREILKRKWHSQGELNNPDKDPIETVLRNDKRMKLRNYVIVNVPKKLENLYERETASDSELLNIDSEDESTTVACGSDDHYFNRTSIDCQCQGACGCTSEHKVLKNTRKTKKKLRKNKLVKFSTR